MFTATFHGATRKRNSTDGNPIWLLHTSEGEYLTEADSSIGYQVSNRTNSRLPGCFIGKRVVFQTTGKGMRVNAWSLEGL